MSCRFTIWSTLIDTAHKVTIPSPTIVETVVATPVIAGLELHVPAGTAIRGEERAIVRSVRIAPISLDRARYTYATYLELCTIKRLPLRC